MIYLSRHSIANNAQTHIEDLKNVGMDIEEQEPDHDLDTLILIIGRYRNISFEQDAQRYLNTLIVGATRKVIMDSAGMVRNESPNLPYISPDDLEQVCRRIFRSKWCFC